ncbi:hypothetical protein [Stenotrophomonas sp.]|uniref:hypothetical protein n=1 Tax=Stenotrophomonas sp. TaxID=69392 RepID=UPI0028A8BD9C|nr:hypothetical protein [Stenotrophomonas sp.]
MRSAYVLGRELQKRVNELADTAGKIYGTNLDREDSLKSHLLDDPIYVVTPLSAASFKVDAPGGDIARALLRDFHIGSKRIEQQWKNTEVLAQSQHVAWTLVSAYYCSFFGAIEAMRVCGVPMLSLTQAEGVQLFAKAATPAPSALLQKSNFRGELASDYSSITFTSSGEKPHKAAWNGFSAKVLPLVQSDVGRFVEISRFKSIADGEGGWESPSDIRNRWNYRDASYFSRHGQQHSKAFLSIVNKSENASRWIQERSRARDELDRISSVAVVAHLLRGAIVESYEHGLLARIEVGRAGRRG